MDMSILNNTGKLEFASNGDTITVDFVIEPTVTRTTHQNGAEINSEQFAYSELFHHDPGPFLTARWMNCNGHPTNGNFWDVDHFAGMQRWAGWMNSHKLYRGLRRAGFDEDAINVCKRIIKQSRKDR